MTDKHTTIAGYSVDLEVGDGISQCYINKGRFSASLEGLTGLGGLTDPDTDAFAKVPAGTIAAIEKWAVANGY